MKPARSALSQTALAVCALFSLLVCVQDGCVRDEDTSHFAWEESECLKCIDGQEESMCTDGEDNDEDGLLDCQDPDCEGIGCCSAAGPEDNDQACSDGCDNDANGYLDCKDYGCSKNPAVTVCCPSSPEDEDTAEKCADGLDNDCNGYFDCADWSCSQSDDVFFCEGNDITCSDGVDNDANGYTDCGDFNCSKNNKVTVCD